MAEATSRNTGLQATLLGIDASVFISFIIVMYHWRIWTLVLFILIVVMFMILKRFGITVKSFISVLLWLIAGKIRSMSVKDGSYIND